MFAKWMLVDFFLDKVLAPLFHPFLSFCDNQTFTRVRKTITCSINTLLWSYNLHVHILQMFYIFSEW